MKKDAFFLSTGLTSIKIQSCWHIIVNKIWFFSFEAKYKTLFSTRFTYVLGLLTNKDQSALLCSINSMAVWWVCFTISEQNLHHQTVREAHLMILVCAFSDEYIVSSKYKKILCHQNSLILKKSQIPWQFPYWKNAFQFSLISRSYRYPDRF